MEVCLYIEDYMSSLEMNMEIGSDPHRLPTPAATLVGEGGGVN